MSDHIEKCSLLGTGNCGCPTACKIEMAKAITAPEPIYCAAPATEQAKKGGLLLAEKQPNSTDEAIQNNDLSLAEGRPLAPVNTMLSDQDILKLVCGHTGKRISLNVEECGQHIDFARAILAAQASPAKTEPTDRAAALADLAYVNGFKSGWMAAEAGNTALLEAVDRRLGPAIQALKASKASPVKPDLAGLTCWVLDDEGDLCQAVQKAGGIADPDNAFVRLSALLAAITKEQHE